MIKGVNKFFSMTIHSDISSHSYETGSIVYPRPWDGNVTKKTAVLAKISRSTCVVQTCQIDSHIDHQGYTNFLKTLHTFIIHADKKSDMTAPKHENE